MKKRISFLAALLALSMLLSGCSYIKIPYAYVADTLSPSSQDTDAVGKIPQAEDRGSPVFVWYGEGESIRVKQMLLSEFTPEHLLRALEKQGVLNSDVAVKSCTMSHSGRMLRLDLSAAFQTALDAASPSGKTVLLRCVVNTFASAYGVSKVRLTVEGNIPLDGGRPYAQPMALRSGDGSLDAFPLYDAASVKRVAITFDDGPHSVYTAKIADKLAEYGATATFFIVGNRLDLGAVSAMKYALGNGNEVGIHGYTHQYNYRNCDEAAYQEELSKTAAAILSNFGVAPTLMRPIGGAITNERVAACPYAVINWRVDSEDWRYKSRTTEEEGARHVAIIVENVMRVVEDGDIILMHELYQNSYEAFCIILDLLYEDGYEVVTVTELLGSSLRPGQKYTKA